MTRLYYLWACLAILTLAVNTAHASFSYCLGSITSGGNPRTVVGFMLWNDNGGYAAQYKSVYLASKTELSNNGWKLRVNFDSGLVNAAVVSHENYGENLDRWGSPGSDNLCPSGRDYNLIYRCVDNMGSGYCDRQRAFQIQSCRTQLNLGSESFNC